MKKIFLFFSAWTVGLFGGLVFTILRILGRIKITGKIKRHKGGMIIIYNHPSLYEPAMLPLVLFPKYLFSLKHIPYSVPDKRNFYDKWWFAPFKIFCVPIERENANTTLRSLREIRGKLKNDGIVIISPEGGRTFKRERFISLRDKKIGKFQNGISIILKGVPLNTIILPIWTEGGDTIIPNRHDFSSNAYLFPRLWNKLELTIGEPVKAGEVKNLEHLEHILLNTADL